MICIYRRLNDPNNFVQYPQLSSNTAPLVTSEPPMNDSYSHRFAFHYANGKFIPDDAVVTQNESYEQLFYEIEI